MVIPVSRLDEVHPDDIVRVNGEFYGKYPHGHFNTRLMIALAADDGDGDLTELLRKRRNLVNDVELAMEELEPDDLREVAKLELLALSHHASETLLRLFYVHAEGTSCPWLRLAELKGLGVTYEIAGQVLDGVMQLPSGDRGLDELVPEILFGVGIPDYDAGLEDPEVIYSVAVEWLRFAADVVKSSPLFNAYKHGLAVSHRDGVFFPGSGSMGAVGEDGESVFVPSYAYVRRATPEETPASWVLDHAQLDERQRAGAVDRFGPAHGQRAGLRCRQKGSTDQRQDGVASRPKPAAGRSSSALMASRAWSFRRRLCLWVSVCEWVSRWSRGARSRHGHLRPTKASSGRRQVVST